MAAQEIFRVAVQSCTDICVGWPGVVAVAALPGKDGGN